MEGQAERIKPARPADRHEAVARAEHHLEGAEDESRDARSACWSPTAPTATLRRRAASSGREGRRDGFRWSRRRSAASSAKGGKRIEADHALSGGPSIFFDAVVVAPSADGAAMLGREAAAIDWLRDAFGHLKVIGVVECRRGAAGPGRASKRTPAVVAIDTGKGVKASSRRRRTAGSGTGSPT